MAPYSNYPRRSLQDLHMGERGVVCAVSSSNAILCNKLLSMGIVSGTSVEVIGIAPLGGPIEIRARGYTLSLRKSEAEGIHLAAS